MKKIVFLFALVIFTMCLIENNNQIKIPDNAIRIRIIANSDDLKDQENKAIIKNEVFNYLANELKNVDNYDDAKRIVESNIDNVSNIVGEHTDNFKINYGNNEFPEKEYKGVRYDKGDYESLLIELGAAKGRNFWCVLFPPLCMIDESKLNDVSYGFYVNELLKKIK